MSTEIPKGSNLDFESGNEPKGPCWYPARNTKDEYVKPLIRCQCGELTGIGLHHVHADGTVTASFFHQRGSEYPEDMRGCGWHVHLKLLDYDCGDFPPET